MKILLIYPPFAMPDKPCISIPTLASYLKSKNIDVSAVDANIEFYRHFLSAENIDRSESYGKKRLMELNGKSELNLPEMIEYSRLVLILNETGDTIDNIKPLFTCSALPSHKKMGLFRQAIQLASLPFFPEWLEFTDSTNYIRYRSKFRKFSSQGILESLKDTTLFSKSLEHILSSNLNGISPQLVGISVAFPDQILPAFKCAGIIRKIMPGVHITLGGTFISCHMREIEEPCLFEIVDSLILDAGEIPLERLIKELSEAQPDLSRVPGLVYFSKGKIRKNPSQPPPELDSLPPPDYTILPLDRYLIRRDRMALLFRLSQGCYWGKCTFCSSELPMIKCYDQFSPELVYQYLKAVIQQTGVRIIHFSDEAAPLPVLDYISNKMIEDNLNVKWVVNLRFDSRLTLERMMLFRKSGCRSIFLGLESCTERLLKLMQKGISMKTVERVLSNIVWGGINANVYMIVGFPTETEEEALYSFRRIKEFTSKGLIKDCIYNIFEISPYSPISLNPEKFGISSVLKLKEEDLAPPVSDFESQGMSREKASELFVTFLSGLPEGSRSLTPAKAGAANQKNGLPEGSRRLQPANQERGNDKFGKEVPEQILIDKGPLHLNFSLNDIRNTIEKISSGEKGSIFFPEFIKRYSDKAKVFRNQ